MKVLRFLGWLFIPYILIFFRWKHLKIPARVLFILWSLILLNTMVHSSNQQESKPTSQVASTQEQPANKSTKDTTNNKPASTTSDQTSKPSTQPSQDQTLEQQKAKLDAEIQNAKNGSYQEKMKALKDYINLDKADLLAKNPTVQDMGFAGDLFIQINKPTVTQLNSVGGQIISQQANGVYWEVNVTLSNAGAHPIGANTNMFTLRTSDGRTFSTDTKAEMMISKPIILDTLNPGVDDTGYIIFDVPSDLNISDVMLNVQKGFSNVKLKLN